MLSSLTINSSSINVTWRPVPPINRNGIITGYTIYITTDVSFVSNTSVDIPSVNTLEYIAVGLEAYVNYTFSILARTAIGDGPPSGPQTSLTNEASKCLLPLSLSFSLINNNISVSFYEIFLFISFFLFSVLFCCFVAFI